MNNALAKKAASNSTVPTNNWLDICTLNDILPNMGCCASLHDKQIAIFRIVLLTGDEQFYALDNYCPFSKSNTLSRGLTGNLNDKIVVASPLYKQHFDLATGQCIEDGSVTLTIYPVRLNGNTIQLAAFEESA
jgi:nitrite reductase (NADH) small subunit